MISNLFSIFDPKITLLSLSLELNWSMMSFSIIIFFNSFWLSKPASLKLFHKMLFILEKEIQLNFSKSPTPGMTHIIVSFFLFILLNNYMGLSPYTFTASSHLSFSLSLALFSWISYLTWMILKDLNSFLSHLVPSGTPYILMPLMVMIELTSNLIRPITLSVRLAANMVAGHLLLTLIASPLSPFSSLLMYLMLTPILVMMILENAVSIIQAYVFSMLSSLYISETNSVKNYLNNFLHYLMNILSIYMILILLFASRNFKYQNY